ncbi:hypothetical protein GCM10018785_11860 [Streptomyces longispororuber]|uniref:Secreted protein n=1 Tax=Streptomyces longispororuber TaxID=68230 RepID=A0A918ZBW9_9ACTN|nr:hypothetical protein [Streptomyces longispororuber]GHE43909.1 hypothetical protein GCM10018785_11860 [Streptomyces longispororuber]
MNKTITRSVTLALVTGALALAAAGTATADTNKNQQTSSISGPTAPILSPGTGPGDNVQNSGQAMIKRHTTNWSVVDYIELPSLPNVAAGAL